MSHAYYRQSELLAIVYSRLMYYLVLLCERNGKSVLRQLIEQSASFTVWPTCISLIKEYKHKMRGISSIQVTYFNFNPLIGTLKPQSN